MIQFGTDFLTFRSFFARLFTDNMMSPIISKPLERRPNHLIATASVPACG